MKLTVLICTRNGSATIAAALRAVSRQIGVSADDYEVLVVDNGSTDGTVEIVQNEFTQMDLSCRIEIEPREGKLNALLHGVQVAKGELISVVDDDNIISEEFIVRTLEFFELTPRIGIVGSHNRLSTLPEPTWFGPVAGRYACCSPKFEGIVKTLDEFRVIGAFSAIPGAGMSFRKGALLVAMNDGFRFMNDAFRGAKVTVSGEDTEQCFLFSQYGYWFGADTRIRVDHRIIPSRLSWQYAKKLSRSAGAGGVAVDAQIVVRDRAGNTMRGTWWWIAARRFRMLAQILPAIARAVLTGRKHDEAWLALQGYWGGLSRALRERGRLTAKIRAMQNSRWLARAVRQRQAFEVLEDGLSLSDSQPGPG
jgi:glycosyltransferase involved in cell wall biosynthesis